MDINYELYKVFYHVASSLSFSEASKQLFISQSAVSQSIKTLEKKIGQPLFIRSTKKVQLTPAGELLLQHIESSHEPYTPRRRTDPECQRHQIGTTPHQRQRYHLPLFSGALYPKVPRTLPGCTHPHHQCDQASPASTSWSRERLTSSSPTIPTPA